MRLVHAIKDKNAQERIEKLLDDVELEDSSDDE